MDTSVIKENSSTYILKFIISCLHCYSNVYVNTCILISKLNVDRFFLMKKKCRKFVCLKNTNYIHKNSPIKNFKSSHVGHLIRFDNLDL